jgi:drug/metabolite transporter (DMT)-like permease
MAADESTGRSNVSAAHSRWAVIQLLLGAMVIGLAPLLVRWSSVGPSATAAWRMVLSAPLFGLALLWSLRSGGLSRNGLLCHWRLVRQCSQPAAQDIGGQAASGTEGTSAWGPLSLRPADWLLLVLPGLAFAGDLSFWHRSLALTSVANATLFTNCAPIFVALAAWLLLKERLRWTYWQGLLLAIGGACMVSLLRPGGNGISTSLTGDGFGIASGLFYAGYILAIKSVRRRFSTLTVMFLTAAVSGIVLFMVAGSLGERIWPTDGRTWADMIALALFIQTVGQGLIVHAMRRLPASLASVSVMLQIVVATAAGWVFLPNESVGLWQGLGGVLIMLGIFRVQSTYAAGEAAIAPAE